MKLLLLSTLLATAPLICAAQTDMDVDLQIGDPGYYGQLEIDDGGPSPDVVYADPTVAIQGGGYYPPVYLYVPPYYYQNWPQYCGIYNACYYPVFFVQPGWYWRVYAPYYRYRHPFGRSGYGPRPYYHGGGGVVRGGGNYAPHYGGGNYAPHYGGGGVMRGGGFGGAHGGGGSHR